MKYLYTIALMLFLLFNSSIYAQKIVQGKVIDAVSRQPLETASIISVNGSAKALSDQYGNFTLHSTNTDNLLVTVSYIGYKSSQYIVFK